MAEIENHFTVLIRLPFNRGDFIDPPPVAWTATKEKELWEIISRQSKTNEIKWKELSEKFEVTQTFLLQQAAWLYERQLSQVRAQMRRVGSRQSSNPSPGPGSMSGSGFGAQATKQEGGGGSRASSRLSVRVKDGSMLKGEVGAPGTPSRLKGSHPPVGNTPKSRQPSKEASNRLIDASTTQGNILPQQPTTRSPKALHISSSSSSSSGQLEDEKSSKPIASHRRNRSSARHRPQAMRTQQSSPSDGEGDENDQGSSPFLPFAATSSHHHSNTDPSATLRGGFGSPPQSSRPTNFRRNTMERVTPSNTTLASKKAEQPLNSSASSHSSGPDARSGAEASQAQAPPSRRHNIASGPATRLSPRRAAELAATGLSPLRRPNGGRDGSDGSPSMGSSFSDLDDASVTQSALEEALLSNMQHGRDVGVASRMSTISQALRSRVFDPGRRQ